MRLHHKPLGRGVGITNEVRTMLERECAPSEGAFLYREEYYRDVPAREIKKSDCTMGKGCCYGVGASLGSLPSQTRTAPWTRNEGSLVTVDCNHYDYIPIQFRTGGSANVYKHWECAPAAARVHSASCSTLTAAPSTKLMSGASSPHVKAEKNL